MSDETGIRRGLTNYGDKDFAQYLRNSFARSMGISREMLAKPIVGIAMTPSSFNNCHRAMPELVDAELSRHQVQVIWLMVTSRVDTVLIWPYQPREVAVKYETLMPVLLAKFPNTASFISA